MNNNFYIHIDADAFFASVEQCLHRELRGKPIVTGRDGGIAVAMSYEAKDLGVERATPIHIIREEFPNVQMVVSDYFMYRIYSNRMLEIIQMYIPSIQRKSIDECSADITREVSSFEEAEILGGEIKKVLEQKLQCTFSIGISSSPLLSKMASGMNKPSGLTIINTKKNTEYLKVPIKKVSGLGRKLCERLSDLGVVCIGDFIQSYPRIRKNFSIVTDDIFQQLQGVPTLRNTLQKEQQSMNRARSFKVTFSREEVFGQLVTNLESLMKKMRAGDFVCSRILVLLKNIERKPISVNIKLPTSTRDMSIIMFHLRTIFDDIYSSEEGYRYASVTLSGLQDSFCSQPDLFGEINNSPREDKMYALIDSLENKFGNRCVTLASTLNLPHGLGSHIKKNTYPITEMNPLLPGETYFKRLKYPFLGLVN